MSRKKVDLTGNTYGRWIVLKRAETKNHGHYWHCQCSCVNKTVKSVAGSSLIGGCSQSCGCLNSELTSIRNKRYNEYDLTGNFGIGYDFNNSEFYFDKEDYEEIKDYCWIVDKKEKYVCTLIKNKRVRLHTLVIGKVKNKIIDHIDGNRPDCRKENLRFVTHHQNSLNKTSKPNTTSGIRGVTLNKSGKWASKINYKGEVYRLGTYKNLEDAIYVRLTKEKELFGEYSGQKHLFSQYDIAII